MSYKSKRFGQPASGPYKKPNKNPLYVPLHKSDKDDIIVITAYKLFNKNKDWTMSLCYRTVAMKYLNLYLVTLKELQKLQKLQKDNKAQKENKNVKSRSKTSRLGSKKSSARK